MAWTFPARITPKARLSRQIHGWIIEGQKFFQPRRYDKTKAQLVFRQQLARRSRAPVKIVRPRPNRLVPAAGRANKNPPRMGQRRVQSGAWCATPARLLLPRALLVAVRLQALPALVLVHLEAAFLF
ncbi:MAG TPA: hypothetical protein VNV15_07920 [Opitutaceae bacterium]|nr:hypothetical protein [Opitutaceae bacterium]